MGIIKELSVRLIPPYSMVEVEDVSPCVKAFQLELPCGNRTEAVNLLLSSMITSVAENKKNLSEKLEILKSSFPEIWHILSEDILALDGSLSLSRNNLSPELETFYRTRKALWQDEELFKHRGADYYAAIDPTLTNSVKIDRVIETLYSSLSFAEKINLNTSLTEKPAILGVLDYVKGQSLVLFHALTYQERYGAYREADESYQSTKELLTTATLKATRNYYRFLLGEVELEQIELPDRSLLTDIFTQMEQNGEMVFKLPEIDNSFEILGFAYNQTLHYPDADTVVASPSGGTEAGIVTQLLYQVAGVGDIPLLLVPISTHSAKQDTLVYSTFTSILDQKLSPYQSNILDQHVLVVDDNSNTGTTINIITEWLQQNGAANVSASTVHADVHRIAIKQARLDTPPNLVASPEINLTSVGIVPITRWVTDSVLSDDRQLLKILRLRYLDKYYKSQQVETLPLQRLPEELSTTKTETVVKVCGVHNEADAGCVIASNQNTWLGLHLTYEDQATYKNKLVKSGDPRALTSYALSKERYKHSNLPLPWAEYPAMKAMIEELDYTQHDNTIVLLMRPVDGAQVIKVLDLLVPKKSGLKFHIQLQNVYNPQLVSEIRTTLNSSKYEDVSLIQMIGADESNVEEVIQKVNEDDAIEMILIDSYKVGGTGKTTSMDMLKSLAKLISKPWFLAGGLNTQNITNFLSEMDKIGKAPIGVDVESSLELKTSKTGSPQRRSHFIKVRKDQEKVTSFMEKVLLYEQTKKFASEYETFNIKSTWVWEVLKYSWETAKQQTGYFNIQSMATAFYTRARELNKLSKDIPQSDFIRAFCDAATLYPMLLHVDTQQTQVPNGEYFENNQISWQVSGLSDVFEQIAQNLNTGITIFTKGDDSAIKSGSFDGTDEQKRRIQLSGIDRVVSDLEKVHQLNSHIFAHPNKMKHFVEQVVMPAKEQARRIVYIEDTETNLDQAVEMIQGYGVEIVPILVCSDTSGSKKYTTIKDISHLPSVIKTYSNSDFVFDMDGVLLHEEFRKEHQPKNIYFALRAKGFLQ